MSSLDSHALASPLKITIADTEVVLDTDMLRPLEVFQWDEPVTLAPGLVERARHIHPDASMEIMALGDDEYTRNVAEATKAFYSSSDDSDSEDERALKGLVKSCVDMLARNTKAMDELNAITARAVTACAELERRTNVVQATPAKVINPHLGGLLFNGGPPTTKFTFGNGAFLHTSRIA